MTISINNWRLEPSLNALIHIETGEVQRLGEFHFILLETLVQHAGEVLPRTMLINEVWKNRVVGNNSLPTAIYALRVALGDDGRMQEIIKTIPKKGYLFSKEAIIEYHDTLPALASFTPPADHPGADGAFTSLVEQIQIHAGDNDREATLAPPTLNPRKGAKTKRLPIFIGLLTVTLAILGYLLYSYFIYNHKKHMPINNLSIQEVNQPYNTMKIYHLLRNGGKRLGPKQTQRAPITLTSLNTLLTERHATMTVYYFTSVQKLSLDIIVKNHCQTEYQLMMNISNWLPDLTKLDMLIYQEVGRTLNEMSACH